jgi:hypothetical protein
MHLLTWQFQPERRGKSWMNTMRVQRNRLKSHLLCNPSLNVQLPAAIEAAYENARIEAATETGQDEAMFPEACAWSPEQVLAPGFWPDHAPG